MPTASTFSPTYGGRNYATTYGSSYSTTSSVGRSGSATRRTPGLTNGYSSPAHGSSQYRTSRPSMATYDRTTTSRKVDDFSSFDSTRRARASPASTRPGPLKADHSTGFGASSRYQHHTTTITPDRTLDYVTGVAGASTFSSRRNSRSGLDEMSSTTPRTLSGRRAASLANLHLDDDPSSRSYRSRTESTDRIAQRPGSRRGSRLEEDIFGSSPRLRQQGGLEDKKDMVGGRSGYTPSLSRESSPGTSNGLGPRSRHYGGEARDELSTSRRGSTSGTSPSGKVKDGGKVGLRNLGNTCFMNSVLQCLSNTKPLLEWCMKDSYLMDINTTTSSMKGALIKAFVTLMKSLWKESSQESYVSPNSFKTQIQKFAPRFMGYSQQDSQEFLRYLLEGIHEDVNRVTVKPKPVVLDDNRLENKSDPDKAKEYWNVYLTRDNSHIVDIFVGQLKSELKFDECGHRSVTFDPFWDLSLPIPKVTSDLTLDACLRLFMKEEEMEAEERPMCSKCKARRSCTKSFSIQRFPQILVIHLKRFSQERYGRKLTSMVDFPVKGLNLSDYSSDGAQKVTYDLYAVSEHSGGVHSGHYTAICKNPYSGDWNTFNDTQVSPARSNQAVSSEAYVLFYELTSPMGRL
ncbi:ubiquitin carboxyl-terminal hydrolase 2-like [Babylonia areolata]|uniref:ubiquitin carboxyl-terminal hydrolase 2-like n=1 Tax=Babylonia areolata TaxID=304850 RepID=UPI003FD25336